MNKRNHPRARKYIRNLACPTVQFGVLPFVAKFNRHGIGCNVSTIFRTSDSLSIPSMTATSAPSMYASFIRIRASSIANGWIASVLCQYCHGVGVPWDYQWCGREIRFCGACSTNSRIEFFTRSHYFPGEMTTSFRGNYITLHRFSPGDKPWSSIFKQQCPLWYIWTVLAALISPPNPVSASLITPNFKWGHIANNGNFFSNSNDYGPILNKIVYCCYS